jgi:hypothetical protein
VSAALIKAITKYMDSIILSSVFTTRKLNLGFKKKKSQIKALNTAASKTGKMSKNIAMTERISSKINATSSGLM